MDDTPGYLQVEALQAIQILLNHWDHDYFHQCDIDTALNSSAPFKPKSVKPRAPYQNPNRTSDNTKNQQQQLQNVNSANNDDGDDTDLNIEGMILSDSSEVLNIVNQIAPTEKQMQETLPIPPTGLGGHHIWKYKTICKGIDIRQRSAQFYTFWCTPTQWEPVPRALAGVWFTYRQLSEGERRRKAKEEEKKIMLLDPDVAMALETVAFIEYRFEHMHMSFMVEVPRDVKLLPLKLVGGDLTESGKTLRLGVASMRVPESLENKMKVGRDIEMGRLLNLDEYRRRLYGVTDGKVVLDERHDKEELSRPPSSKATSTYGTRPSSSASVKRPQSAKPPSRPQTSKPSSASTQRPKTPTTPTTTTSVPSSRPQSSKPGRPQSAKITTPISSKPSSASSTKQSQSKIQQPESQPAPVPQEEEKELANSNGVPFSVIKELSESTKYPVLTSSKILTRNHLDLNYDVADIPTESQKKINDIKSQKAAAEAERLKRLEDKEKARLQAKKLKEQEDLENKRKKHEAQEALEREKLASASSTPEPGDKHDGRHGSGGGRYTRSGRRLSRTSNASFIERRSSQPTTTNNTTTTQQTPLQSTTSALYSDPSATSTPPPTNIPTTGSRPTTASGANSSLNPNATSGGSLPGSRRPSSLTTHWLSGLPDVQQRSISAIDLSGLNNVSGLGAGGGGGGGAGGSMMDMKTGAGDSGSVSASRRASQMNAGTTVEVIDWKDGNGGADGGEGGGNDGVGVGYEYVEGVEGVLNGDDLEYNDGGLENLTVHISGEEYEENVADAEVQDTIEMGQVNEDTDVEGGELHGADEVSNGDPPEIQHDEK
jgi:hypothetical protein